MLSSAPDPSEKLPDVAFLARALSDANRLRILCCLQEGEKSVNQIAEILEISQPLVSHHLKELKRALLVRVERRGPFVFYTLARREILAILKALGSLAEVLLAEKKTL